MIRITVVGVDEPQRADVVVQSLEVTDVERVAAVDEDNVDLVSLTLSHLRAPGQFLGRKWMDGMAEAEAPRLAGQERRQHGLRQPWPGSPVCHDPSCIRA